MKLLDPNVIAFFTVRVVIDKINCKSNKLLAVDNNIGKQPEHELRYTSLEEQQPWLFKKLLTEIDTTRICKRQKLVAAYNLYFEEWASWGDDARINLDMKLLHIFTTKTGFADIITRSYAKNRTEKLVVATAAVNEFLEKNRDVAEMLSPVYLPVVVSPQDWADPRGGGYLTHHTPTLKLIKTSNRNYLEELKGLPEQMAPVYKAINHIQRKPRQINTSVMVVVQMLDENAVAVGGLTSPENEPLPPRVIPEGLKKEELTEKQLADFKLWKQRLQSKRLMMTHIQVMAKHLSAYNATYFPQTADFRGRLYPASSHLTPQGNSLAKGFLKFADGEPLGTN